MAYDQSHPYQPPQRPYVSRNQSQHMPATDPYQNAVGPYDQQAEYDAYAQNYHDYQQQDYYDPQAQGAHDGYAQGYDYGYGDTGANGMTNRPMPQRHAQHRSEGPSEPQDSNPRQDSGYYEQGRAYDAQYQRKGPVRGPPPGQQGNPHRQAPPSARPRPATAPGRPGPPSQDPRAAPRSHNSQKPPPGMPPAQRRDPQRPPPTQHQTKPSMEDWKAQERARLHAKPHSPDSVPQDNAFPSFPKAKESPGKSRRSGPAGNRSSEEQRPGTAHSAKSLKSEGTVQQPRMGVRHPVQSQTHFHPSNNGAESNPMKSSPPNQQSQPYRMQPPAASHTRPSEGNGYRSEQAPYQPQQQSWPLSENRSSSDSSRAARPAPQFTNPSYGPIPNNGAQRPAPNNVSMGRSQIPTNQSAPTPAYHQEQTSLAALDTSMQPPLRRPEFLDHQPLSPVETPVRPSTSHGTSKSSQTVASSTSQYSHSATPSNPYAGPKSWEQITEPQRNDTLADLYDDYAKPLPTTKTREQEIEDEMPDFDSAAPNQTSHLTKRSQHSSGRGSTEMTAPTKVAHVPTQFEPPLSSPVPDLMRPGTASGVKSQASRPIMTATPAGQAFQHERSYQIPAGIAVASPTHGPPFQAPFAAEPQGRHSLDDARHMGPRSGPRQGPPGRPNGQSPAGMPPPQQRLGYDRVASAPPARGPPPAQYRGPGSAPPQSGPMPSKGPSPFSNGQAGADGRPAVDPQRNTNPDSLPHHPVPVRPGLMEGNTALPTGPPPVRNYTGSVPPAGPPVSARPPPPSQAPAETVPHQPITFQELNRLRAAADANPQGYKQNLLLCKRLIEAADVLAPENGVADAKTTAKNRERYLSDAHKRLKKLAASGYPEGQFFLADCYGEGSLEVGSDPRDIFNLYQAAAKSGHAQAAYRTACCCEMGAEDGGGTRKDLPKAVQWFRRAAALGDTGAMYKLSAISIKGLLEQPRNPAEGIKWLRQATDRPDISEHPRALQELAALYESTNAAPEIRAHLPANDTRARELYLQAAQLGHRPSQFRLGQAYEYGQLGLALDNRSSILWYSRAAAQAHHEAELALSGWYLTGAEGILEQSDAEAYLWARKAARAEPPLAKAMYAMGYFTETGIGCPVNLEEAKKWYTRAASYKFPKAVQRLEELKRSAGKSARGAPPPPANGKLTRKDVKRDEAECALM